MIRYNIPFCILLWLLMTLGIDAHAQTPETDQTAAIRTDLFISGVYPHLTTYGVYSQNGGHFKQGHNECGIGAIVPWAGKLWMVNYAPHMPRGSEHKLFSIDADLSKPLTIRPESVGGTPAGRMIHAESNQLLIAHYAIDSKGDVRAIQPTDMPIRVTAIARHLTDPANMVYYIDMEGSIWEANVHTLAVNRLFKKPVPGWHGKGGYTSQGRLVVSNNGELHVGDYSDLLVGGPAKDKSERGVLAEWDGTEWRIIERRQFTEVTGPKGITGGTDGDDPVWSIGWDERSLRLKLLDDGKWLTYLLPKAAYCNDASHGWYTEWPRIREITDGRWMMDMHGMFFDFPPTFSQANTAGLRPIASHLRYVPDFCAWNGRLVLATDETSIQENHLAGQPQSNLWFGSYDELKQWGPASGYGGPWIEDEVKANVPSDPFLVAGFDRRQLYLSLGRRHVEPRDTFRTSDQQIIHSMPKQLASLTRVAVPRGDWHQPAPGFEFTVDQPVTVYLAVDQRGRPTLDPRWTATDLQLTWGEGFSDVVYRADFAAGPIEIPANTTEHRPGSFGMPHLAFVESRSTSIPKVSASGNVSVVTSGQAPRQAGNANSTVTFTLQVDVDGSGQWVNYHSLVVSEDQLVSYIFPEDFAAEWLRIVPSRDCVATAFLHQTSASSQDGTKPENELLFAGLADLDEDIALGGQLYAAKRNRNLRVITSDERFLEFSKNTFVFSADHADEKLSDLLKVDPVFKVDASSVIIEQAGRVYRLPKGDPGFDRPLLGGWPRDVREVESERLLANIHGTFYEVPLITNGAPPAWNLMRPVSSHRKQISDYCSWNGLLVLAGVNQEAPEDGHVIIDRELNMGLWFGGIDDLWKLGKPIGTGGPWKETTVLAGVNSAPYLMTGYDRKEVIIEHDAASEVAFTLEVDIAGNGQWLKYESFNVKPGQKLSHKFPEGFSAMWVRARCSQNCKASVQFTYQ